MAKIQTENSAGITKELATGKFTDQMLADMRALIGTELRTEASINNEYATRFAILRFCEGIGDDNPVWTDPAYAEKTSCGTLIAPPSFIFACLAGVQVGWPGLGGFHADTKIDFHRSIRVGDKIKCRVVFQGFVRAFIEAATVPWPEMKRIEATSARQARG